MSDIIERPSAPAAGTLTHPSAVPSVRLSADNDKVLADLGLLAELAGTWRGHGFNLVARPDKQGNANLFLELNQTEETLKFDPIATSIPNRGFVQDDIELFGLTYLQQISDAVTGGALHIEPGIWVTLPSTTPLPAGAPAGARVVGRMGSIPHGNAILAEGFAAQFTGAPTLPSATAAYNGSSFPSFNSTPFGVGAPIFAPGTAEFDVPVKPPAPAHGFTQYTLTNPATTANPRTPLGNIPEVPLPAEINGVLMQDLVNDPIRLLQSTIAKQQAEGFTFEGVAINIASQVSIPFGTEPNQSAPSITVSVSSGDGGGIENLPFLEQNAQSALVYATFWIERVSHPHSRDSFLQLQYAQMVLLNFPILLAPAPKPDFSWPHVSVATLRKSFG
jgi:hypothetical protein